MLPGEPLLCGDFNCPSGAGAVDSQLLEVLSDRSLLQVINQPTHLAGNIRRLHLVSLASHKVQYLDHCCSHCMLLL